MGEREKKVKSVGNKKRRDTGGGAVQRRKDKNLKMNRYRVI